MILTGGESNLSSKAGISVRISPRWRFHRWQRIFFFPDCEWFTLQNQHICWSIFCAANFEEAKDRKMSRNTFQLAALRHKPLDYLKWRIWPRFRIILHFVDVTRIKPAHFRRSNSTLGSFSGMVWTITTDFDLHATSSNIAKLHVHSEFKVEFGDANVEQQRFVKKGSVFFTIAGSCTRTPPRERCVWNQTEFLLWIFVIFDWSLLIFIAIQTGTHAKNLHNLIQSHSVCCGLRGCEIGSFTSNMSIFRAGLGVSTCAAPWWLKLAVFLCFSSCRSEDLPTQLPRLRVAIFNAFPSRVLPHPGARCHLEWCGMVIMELFFVSLQWMGI